MNLCARIEGATCEDAIRAAVLAIVGHRESDTGDRAEGVRIVF